MTKYNISYYKWKTFAALVVSLVCVAATANAKAEVALIGNTSLSISALSPGDASDLFLGKSKTLSDGTAITVVDLPKGNATKNEFYEKVIRKNPNQIRAYWAKRIFTGKGSPPSTLMDDSAVMKWVAGGDGRIGYVDSKSVDDSVKVLLKIP